MAPAALVTTTSTTVLPLAARDAKMYALGTHGGGGGGEGGRPGKAPMPHISDITSVTVGSDAIKSIETLLQEADSLLKQADFSKDFGRPDMALRDYIRACAMVLDLIKKNKGWASLQKDHKTQLERYKKLVRKIETSHDEYDRIKAEIKAENARTGVQPANRWPPGDSEADRVQERRQEDGQKETATPDCVAPPRPRTRPAIAPKPQGLHGHILKPTVAGAVAMTNKGTDDLARRFANLRPISTTQLQRNSRIKTQPCNASKRSESFCSAPAPVPGLPRVPDAVYSPARGTVSNAAAELPSSTPRCMFSRTNSMVTSQTRNAMSPTADDKNVPSTLALENYVAKQAVRGSTWAELTGDSPRVTDSSYITVDGLLDWMKMGTSKIPLLVVDLRSREEFNEGHIMSPAPICIPRQLVLRGRSGPISASKILDAICLEPEREQALFDRRNLMVVVFYDQSSTEIKESPRSPEEKAVYNFFMALTDYETAFKPSGWTPPKLLVGGLDAWTDKMGTASLQVMAPKRRAQDALEFPRDKSEFMAMRLKKPRLSQRESMLDPATEKTDDTDEDLPDVARSFSFGDNTSILLPPTRPAPTVPRTSHSGLDNAESLRPVKVTGPFDYLPSLPRRGMRNPRFWCYALSALQMLYSCPDFRRDVVRRRDQEGKGYEGFLGELSRVFDELGAPKPGPYSPASFMAFIRQENAYDPVLKNKDGTKRRRDPDVLLGGDYQQDIREFCDFLLDGLHRERRAKSDGKLYWNGTRKLPFQPSTPYYTEVKFPSVLQKAVSFWRDYLSANDSIVDKWFRGVVAEYYICPKCHHEWSQVLAVDHLIFVLNDPEWQPEKPNADFDLVNILRTWSVSINSLRKCDKCDNKGLAQYRKLLRTPQYLCIQFDRTGVAGEFHKAWEQRVEAKITKTIRFPIQGLHFPPLKQALEMFAFLSPLDAESQAFIGDERHDWQEHPTYNCIGIVHHLGENLQAGHYVGYFKDDGSADEKDWLAIDDSRVERFKLAKGPAYMREALAMLSNSGGQACTLMYQRLDR